MKNENRASFSFFTESITRIHEALKITKYRVAKSTTVLSLSLSLSLSFERHLTSSTR